MTNQNEIIAQFMGIEKCDRCVDCGMYKFGTSNYVLPRDMRYGIDWDWFHPAWHKFNDLSKTQWFEHRGWCIKISLLILHEYTPAKAAKELAEAITWYNSQTPNK